LLVSLLTYRRQRIALADVARGRGPADLRKMAALEAEVEAAVGREESEVQGVRMRVLEGRSLARSAVNAESEPSRADEVSREIPI